MGKVKTLFAGHREEEIKEISIGQKVRQKFETSLEDVSNSKLKTIADFDKKYQLQTKGSVQKDGTNLVLRFDSKDLKKKTCLKSLG